MASANGRDSSTSGVTRRRLRADAMRHRDLLLAAARDVFVERGADAALDEVARRAGVGIATLYRRFPDRQALQRAVALDVLERAARAAESAEAGETDALTALGRYMHAALDLRISAVMPALLGSISFVDDATILAARERAVQPVLRMLEAGQAAGELRDDVAFADIGTLLVRLSRPLPGPIPPDVDWSLAHRHVDLFLDALRTAHTPLPGPALSLGDLQAIAQKQPFG